jgi:hypothetical protein
MKYFFFFIVFFQSYCQTKLEILVLKELNAFRKLHNNEQNEIRPVNYSVEISKAAKHHAKWMAIADSCTHYETIDVPNFKELFAPEDRGEFYNILDDIYFFGEICNISKAIVNKFPNKNYKPNEVLAKDIIMQFAASKKGHREGMLIPVSADQIINVGISTIIKGTKAYTTIFFVIK